MPARTYATRLACYKIYMQAVESMQAVGNMHQVCLSPCRTTLACTPGLHQRLLQSLKPKTEALIQQKYQLGTWYVPEVYEQYLQQVSS